ncbi:MAG: hypothetical protein HND52_20790 [Ignavibacteriae bacterium]|nr:hypothetical protein [Ignavibacteriota bacterium]NOH00409.1 hypothetical protein [Ignavibacteriota bacterium]
MRNRVRSHSALVVTLVLVSIPSIGTAQVTQIIDKFGDGAGNRLNDPLGLALDGSGNIYVSGVLSDNVFRITPGGTITELVDWTGDGLGNMLVGPTDIAVDGSGNVYVACLVSDNAFKITPAGVITELIDATGDGLGNTLHNCVGISVDGSGNVYVSGRLSDNAFKITPGGVITELIDGTGDGLGNTLDGPGEIALDGSGNVYVACIFSDNVFRITPGGVITEIIDATGDGAGNPLSSARGLAVDGSGTVYVSADGSSNVFEVSDPAGANTITEIIDSTGDGMGNPLYFATGVVADAAGEVHVAGWGSDNVFRITPGGVITEIIDATGDGAGHLLDDSYKVAQDPAGSIYVTGSFSDNAFRICFGSFTPYGSACSGSVGGSPPELSGSGCLAVGQDATLQVTGGTANGLGGLFFGASQTAIPAPWGCTVLVTPGSFALLFMLDGTGSVSVAGSVPPSASGQRAFVQAFLQDSSVAGGFATTSGLEIEFP